MKIKTITCHDVYNVGASLQAYALVKYLNNLGYDTEIIDYKPPYLEHYKLTGVDNPAYDRPIFRQAYQILKFPMRLVNRLSKRKKVFDNFTKKYLPRTERKYISMVELRENLPYADLYIAGSDQIWNPLFRNGKDPAFFLNFAPDNSRKISYAASFAVDDISEEDRNRMEQWLKRLDAISVRETSGVALLRSMNLQGTQVCDPVFLLNDLEWKQLAVYPKEARYLFVYDFDNNEQLQLIARKLAKKRNLKIVSVFPMKGADMVYGDMGPKEFIGTICNAEIIISNSFHATAFSIIFEKEFYVINRKEQINTRMRDLLLEIGLEKCLVSFSGEIESNDSIVWESVNNKMNIIINRSKSFLKRQVEMVINTGGE